jgi:hypothetical protein
MVSKPVYRGALGARFGKGTALDQKRFFPRGMKPGINKGISPEPGTGLTLLDPCQRKAIFLVQLCLSGGAGLSIILPTLPRKPWFCFPDHPVLNRNHVDGCFFRERVLEY